MGRNHNKPALKTRIESLVDEMLDGSILLDEATAELERIFIMKALERNERHISRTAAQIGIHRNTLSKKLNEYDR